MKTSDAGIAFLIKEEGFRTKAYKDSRGIWTIGVGHTSAAGPPDVKPGLVITEAEVHDLLKKDIAPVENLLNKVVTTPLNQNEFDALVSLIHNIGGTAFKGSTVLRKLNEGKRQDAADAFLLWKKAGKDLDILLPRRKRERTLFLTPVKPVAAPPAPVQEVPATPVANPQEPSLVASLWALFLYAIRKK